MRTTRLVAWIAVLSAATTVSAAPIVDVGSHPLLDNTSGQTIELWVTGDGNLAGLNLFVQVGDGGPELAGYGVPAGTDGPSIAAVNLQPLGGIFTGKGTQTNLPGIPQVAIATLDVTTGTVNANGLLLTLTIDTTGFSSGSWPLMLKGVLPFSSLGGPYDTTGVGPGGQTVAFSITNGSLTIPGITNWKAVSGNWSDSNCWTAGEPNASLRANITNGGTATISLAGESSAILTLGSAPGQSGAVDMTGGALNCGVIYVGYAGIGTFAQSGGTHTVLDRLFVGYSADANGLYILGDGNLVTRSVSVGSKGILTFSGGVLRGDASDANVRTDVYNGGLVQAVSGSQVLGRILGMDANTPLGTVSVDANASLSVRVIRQNAMTVGPGAKATLQGGSKTASVLNALNIAGATDAWTGTLDVMHNALVVQASGDANVVYAQMANQARYACNSLNWDRPGLTSTTARDDANKLTAVAVVLNRDDSTSGSPAFLSSFDAVPDPNWAVSVGTQSILVKYTWYGDADLNGIVDERDLDRFATGYSDERSGSPIGLAGWAWGDFDNNGTIDERDLDLFSTAYSVHGGPLSPESFGGPGAAPEPGTLVLIGLGLAALVSRRGRKA